MSGKYKIGKIRKLVDLNKNLINFNLDFVIHSEDKNSTFEIAVVTQDTLDNNYPIKYQKAANGYISGNVKSDNNTYNNYLIVIRAEKDMDVSVDLTIREIMGAQQPMGSQQPSPNQEVKHEEPNKQTQENFDIYTNNIHLFTRKNLLIFFIIVILASCIYIYYYYTNTKDTALDPAGSKSTEESGGNALDSDINKSVKEIISPLQQQEIIHSETLRYPNHTRLFESIK
jgi:hypothetical protein